jgi:hypothetical protein
MRSRERAQESLVTEIRQYQGGCAQQGAKGSRKPWCKYAHSTLEGALAAHEALLNSELCLFTWCE